MNLGSLVQQAMQAVPSTLRKNVTLELRKPVLADAPSARLGAANKSTVEGTATQARSDSRRLEALRLTETDVQTLLFVPKDFGQVASNFLNATLPWGGKPYTVRSSEPIAPDGSGIAFLFVIAR